eukprot:3777456-Pyramimonas_sp.AAC.1
MAKAVPPKAKAKAKATESSPTPPNPTTCIGEGKGAQREHGQGRGGGGGTPRPKLNGPTLLNLLVQHAHSKECSDFPEHLIPQLDSLMQDYRSSKEQDLPKSKRLLRVDRQLDQQQAKLATLEKE